MNNMEEKRDFYLAELKYFNTDVSNNKKVGIENIDPFEYGSNKPLSYVLLITDDGINYRNALNEDEEYVTYKHTKEPQYHLFPNGELEIIGFKISPTNKDAVSEAGPCWLLTDTVYKDKTLSEMELFVDFNNKLFFKDKNEYIDSFITNTKTQINSIKARKRMIKYFNDHDVHDFDDNIKYKVFSKNK